MLRSAVTEILLSYAHYRQYLDDTRSTPRTWLSVKIGILLELQLGCASQ